MTAMVETPASPDQSSPDYAAASRAALVEALIAAGPGMPTLCEGWRTEHLAAHLVLRESSPAAAGLLLPPLAAGLERRTRAVGDAHASDRSFAALVDRVEHGPLGEPDAGGLGSGLRRLAGRARRTRAGRAIAGRAQLLEFFVHTEDVRRAQERWAPRILADDYADTLYTHLCSQARLLYRGEGTGVELVRRARGGSRTDNGPRTVVRAPDGATTLRVSGAAGELVLHAFGRRRAALAMEDRVSARSDHDAS